MRNFMYKGKIICRGMFDTPMACVMRDQGDPYYAPCTCMAVCLEADLPTSDLAWNKPKRKTIAIAVWLWHRDGTT